MDGQQRITALQEFFGGKFELSDLKQWPEINGRTYQYQTLPEKIKAGLDRRSITSIVLLKESTSCEEEASSLRETVFERLNTGGVELTRQEIRNALYRGRMNNLIDRLSRMPVFRKAWEFRVYFVRHGAAVYVLLCGGDKSSQRRDIARAKRMARELKESGR